MSASDRLRAQPKRKRQKREPSVWVVEERIDGGDTWAAVDARVDREDANYQRDDWYARWKKPGSQVRVSEYRRVPTRRKKEKP